MCQDICDFPFPEVVSIDFGILVCSWVSGKFVESHYDLELGILTLKWPFVSFMSSLSFKSFCENLS